MVVFAIDIGRRMMELRGRLDSEIRALDHQSETELFAGMSDHMPLVGEITNRLGRYPDLMPRLMERHPSFRLYAQVLEGLAKGLRAGEPALRMRWTVALNGAAPQPDAAITDPLAMPR